jgi:hypothetical protein
MKFTAQLLGYFLLLVAPLQAAHTARVDSASPVLKFDGWGTSLCWFANAVGNWPEPERSAIADLLFSTEGLGLTVVRYNIGGGENPTHQHMPAFRQMDGFQPSAGQWDWTADAGQRWMLRAAIARGANRLEAFSNSPPYWMTLSQCASGNANPSSDNLDPRRHRDFAEYLAAVVLHFRDEWGIAFQTLDPFNEPFSDYWKAHGRQEGCHFDRSTQNTLINLARSALYPTQLNAEQNASTYYTNLEHAICKF